VTRISISSAQRDALYEHILSRLSGIGDVWLAVDAEDFETATRLGQEYADDLRLLLDDLGWGATSSGEVELSADPALLRRIFTRLKDTATSQRASEEAELAEVRTFVERRLLVTEACDIVLSGLAADEAA
jgi:hypothetical protein